MRQSRWVTAWAAIAVFIGLIVTAHAVFSPRILEHYADSPDSVDISQWAARADSTAILNWWTGSWIQESSPYYRPLSSMVFWLEYLAFGYNFQGHVLISWLVHGVICCLIYALGLAVLPGRLRVRAVIACAAVVLFNLRLGPRGYGWLTAPISYGVVAWWPAQTDQFSLATSLGALILFDRWLCEGRRSTLWGAALLWIVSLLFKEMAIALPGAVAFLILHRRRWRAFALPVRSADEGPSSKEEGGRDEHVETIAEDAAGACEGEDQGRGQSGADSLRPPGGGRGARRGIGWLVLIPTGIFVAAYLYVRRLLVPGAWGPELRGAGYFIEKFTWYVAGRPTFMIDARGIWVVVVSVYIAALIYLYARLPRRPSIIWLILAIVIGSGLLCQALAGNFALVTVPREIGAITSVTIFMLGIVVLVHVRGGPAWALLGAALIIHLPILHVQGPHYFYWPAAFWGLFHASLLQYVWRMHREGRLQWGKPGAHAS